MVDLPVRCRYSPNITPGGWGSPGIAGHRDGADWSPLFTTTALTVDAAERRSGLVVGRCRRGAGSPRDDTVADLGLVLDSSCYRAACIRARAEAHERAATPSTFGRRPPARASRSRRRPARSSTSRAGGGRSGPRSAVNSPLASTNAKDGGTHRPGRRDGALRRRTRIRVRPRRSVGHPRRVQRQPPPLRRTSLHRFPGGRRRGTAPAGRGTARGRRELRNALGLRRLRRRPRRPGTSLPRLSPVAAHAPAARAPGDDQRVGGGLFRPRPGPVDRTWRIARRSSASNAMCSTTAGSGTGATIWRAWATGTSTRRCGRTVCIRSSITCVPSAWSSACGSNRR